MERLTISFLLKDGSKYVGKVKTEGTPKELARFITGQLNCERFATVGAHAICSDEVVAFTVTEA